MIEPAATSPAEPVLPTGRLQRRDDWQAVIFDLGNVLLGWSPEGPYAQVIPASEVAALLARIDFPAWNRSTDGGRPFAEAEQELIDAFPDDAEAIRAYRRHFAHALTGPVPGTAAVIAELGAAGLRLTALTNWSAETFPVARARFGILQRFSDIVVSGTEGVLKPDPAIFALACARSGLDPARTVFVDDLPGNVAAATAYGLTGVLFSDAATLRADLTELGLLPPAPPRNRPIYHLALRKQWQQAQSDGSYPWSGRGIGFDAEGFVHGSYAHQYPRVRRLGYGDLADDELVLLRLDPSTPGFPVVDEDLAGEGERYPHVFAPLRPDAVTAEPYSEPARD